jgi:ABC-2 type transport system ATP-binding protein
MENEIAIKVENVSKTFKLPHEKNTSIKGTVVNFYKRKNTFEQQKALDNVTFEVRKGEFFGIVGRNGSGKSTLLKMLAGIYTPTQGSIKVNGKLTPFIELGVGFNAELTGRENVYLNGALLGFNRAEMQEMYEEIVEFAELERFMDQKLKNYSSGMQVRLAFSIAIRARTDILLIDEVLAVGDEAFQRKCFKYFDELKKQSKTVVFVSHDMSAFEKYCDRGILINSGNLVYSGEPFLISAEYKMLNAIDVNRTPAERSTALSFDNSIKQVKLNGGERALLKQGDKLTVEINVKPTKNTNVVAGISIVRNDGVYVAFHSTLKNLPSVKVKSGKACRFLYDIDAGAFMPGVYSIDVALYDDKNDYIDLKSNTGQFVIAGEDKSRSGIIKLNGEWKFHAEA